MLPIKDNGQGYKHEEYPKWKYHYSLEPCIVNNAAEERKLGGDWKNSPDDCYPPIN